MSACVITLRWTDKPASQASARWQPNRMEGILCLVMISCGGFTAGLFYRLSTALAFPIIAIIVAVFAIASLFFRQVSKFQIYVQLFY